MDNRKIAIKELLSELQKSEDSAKEKGYVDISEVEVALNIKY